MGLVTLFNNIGVLPTIDYVKILVETYITRMSEKSLNTWMHVIQYSQMRMPFPNIRVYVKAFLSSICNPDEKQQK